MEKNSILMQNEMEANKFSSIVTLCSNVFILAAYILNLAGIFVVPMLDMTIASIASGILLSIPILIVVVLKQQGSWVKYVTVTSVVLMVSIITVILKYHVVVLFAFPLAVSSLFFSRKLSWYTSILSVVFISAAQALSFTTTGVNDRNFDTINGLVIFGILPKALELSMMSVIFIILSKRTRKMLGNMMGAKEQEEMLEKMIAVTTKSTDVSNTLAQSVNSLSLMTENTTKSNQDIALRTTKLAEGSKSSIKCMEDASSEVTNMSENLQKITDESNQIGALSEQVKKLTENNEQVMFNAVEKMSAIAIATKQSKEIIAKLEQRSSEISNFVEVITQISEQTNLLAINAAIESARAGEQGKGFSVVAQEIRNLAEEAQKAAKDISLSVNKIIVDTQEAVSSMDNGSELVDMGLAIIEEARNSFTKVADANKDINNMLTVVNGDTLETAELSKKIVDLMADVKNTNTNALYDIEQIALASGKLVASMEEVDTAVGDIETMSKELLEVVQK
ncbi:methyl-accepting chemotaxis protein [Acetivibrio cellulolyticus]|uniref:methyl-accepting chemotaxis protein n=1 Tax=Acetivibrio cellulolyticus TaxID=35830 RepID=UPI0001E2C6D8|nr:methyl-accepting chemotaxis protein [Acetivibrio cellulolyticus]